ncbi:hypothetical protein [Streptomyces indicus]|uniref:Uncharacterized protein n=1 Tax=Streptomyces indicus TaxID=417292 RepID=A0A1G9C9Y2_9ACTN|nr:hypothetical protein [Streptomyces indicus]SDK48488.1 hypothetical protein SAMN05421806_10821 [Streptomyces indicus]
MDLQGVGAIAAAVVAAVGIPSALIIGRWQMQGAMRNAEETARAGIAQAEANYRAALDAVKTTAIETHRQWRRGIQRDAYATFLIVAHQTREDCERCELECEEDVSDGEFTALKINVRDHLKQLKEAQTIIELEGPDAVASAAAAMVNELEILVMTYPSQADYSRAWGKLLRATTHSDTRVSSPASDYLSALYRLKQAFTSSDQSHSMTEEQRAQEIREARAECSRIEGSLDDDTLSDDERFALRQGNSPSPPSNSQHCLQAIQAFQQAEERFVRVAKDELHSTNS